MTAPVRHDVFLAIADPTRRRILELLAEEESSVSRLVERFDVSQPAVSQHLAVLRDAGLVEARREGRLRIYRLRAEPIRVVADWTIHFSRFWDAKLDALAKYLDRQKHERQNVDRQKTGRPNQEEKP